MIPLVFFDVDHTLIMNTSAEAIFIRWLLLHKKISFGNIAATAKFFFQHLDDVGGTAIRGNKLYLKGMRVDELQCYAERVAQEELHRYVSHEGIKEIQKLKTHGTKVVLLSASPAALIKHVQRFVGADDSIATHLQGREGVLTGFIDGVHPYGSRKVKVASEYAAQRHVSLMECGAYANAASDLPLLRSVGTPHAVNPDGRLWRYAQRVKWPIDRFS